MVKKGEHAVFQISTEFVEENKDEERFKEFLDNVEFNQTSNQTNEESKEKTSSKWDVTKDLWADCTMHRLYKVEDWFKDGKVLMKTIRKGKGRKPYIDSICYCKSP